jgi:hypothetical protein
MRRRPSPTSSPRLPLALAQEMLRLAGIESTDPSLHGCLASQAALRVNLRPGAVQLCAFIAAERKKRMLPGRNSWPSGTRHERMVES